MKATLKKIFLFLAILLLLGICLASCFVLQISTGTSVPMVFGWGCAFVKSEDMEPTVPAGSLITVHTCDTYTNGDIVAYYDTDGSIAVHKISRFTDNEIPSAVEANNTPVPGIAAEQIIGKVEHIISGGNVFVDRIRRPLVRVAIISALFLMWLALKAICKKASGWANQMPFQQGGQPHG